MATKKEVKLIGAWPSPYVMRARIALDIKSVDYEVIEDNLRPKSELLLKSNPVHKKIPVLIHGDTPICESLIIVEYIDEIWSSSGHSILPSDPYGRAIARFWGAYIDNKLWPAMNGLKIAKDDEEKGALMKQIMEGLGELEEAYNKISKGKDFFGGEKIGYIDIALGSFVGWLRVIEKLMNMKVFDEALLPSLVNWANNFCSNDVVINLMPQTHDLLEVAKLIFANYKTFCI